MARLMSRKREEVRQSGVFKKPEARNTFEEKRDHFAKERERLGDQIRSLLEELEEAQRNCGDRSIRNEIDSIGLASGRFDRFKLPPEIKKKKTA